MSESWYDTAKVGDLSPTPFHGTATCREISPDERFGCTRPKCHTGQHVGEGMVEVLSVWPPEVSP